jgi:hypothetical protein
VTDRMMATSEDSTDRAFGAGFQRAPGLHRDPEVVVWKLVPLSCTCGDLREAYDRSYPPYPPSGRGSCTEVDIRGQHERGSP